MTPRDKRARAARPERPARPDLTEALRSSDGPGALVGFLAAGALLLGAALFFALAWALAALGVPWVAIVFGGVALLLGVFVLLQRSVRD